VVAVLAWTHVPGRVQRLAAQGAGLAPGGDHQPGPLHEGAGTTRFEPDPQRVRALLDVLEQRLFGDLGIAGLALRLDHDQPGVTVPGQGHRADAELLVDRLVQRLDVGLGRGERRTGSGHDLIEQLLMKRVDGIIVTARRADPRAPLEVPAHSVPVLYAFAQASDPKALSLLPDDEGGGRLAGEHLIAAGRRRIAHITGPEDFEAVRHRSAGFRRALEQHGLPWRSRDVISGPWSEAGGHAAVARLLARNARIDAIFCGSDQIARGAVDALRDRGVRVPDDIAVVGFDNWQVIAAATRPPLTSIDMNLHELGRQAGLRLLEMIDGKRLKGGVVRLPCSLVMRESCGTARRIESAARAIARHAA